MCPVSGTVGVGNGVGPLLVRVLRRDVVEVLLKGETVDLTGGSYFSRFEKTLTENWKILRLCPAPNTGLSRRVISRGKLSWCHSLGPL